MEPKEINIAIFVVSLLLGFLIIRLFKPTKPAVVRKPKPTPPAPGTVFFTAEEVATHNKDGDIWFIIENKVYNVSDYHHPGGEEAFLKFAGKDCTEAFKGLQHSVDQVTERGNIGPYYVGDLKVKS